MKSNHLLPKRITASIPSHQPKMSAKVLLPLLPVVSQDILLAIFSKAFSLTEFLLLLFLNYDHNPFFFFFFPHPFASQFTAKIKDFGMI